MQHHFESLISALPDPLMIVDQNGFIIWCNDRVEPLLGYPAQALIGSPVDQLVPQQLRNYHRQWREQLNLSDSQRPMSYASEPYALARDGSQVPVDIELAPLQWHGQPCILAILRSRAAQLARQQAQQKQLRESEDRLQRSQAIARIGCWDWDITGNNLIWTDEIYRIFGTSPAEFEASYDAFLRFIHPDDRQTVIDAVDTALQQRQPYQIEHRICRPDGKIRHVREIGKVFLDDEGQPTRMLGTVQEITREKKNRLRLQLSQTMFNHSYEGILTADPGFRIIAANPALTKSTGFSPQQLIGQPLARLLPEQTSRFTLRPILKQLRQHGHWQGELQCRRHNASPFPVLLSITAVTDDPQSRRHYVVNLTDISQLKQNEQRLEQLAHYDPLTGLPNRTFFLQRFEQLLSDSKQQDGTLTTLYIDLDGFKRINDTQGHNVGDQLLREVAERLRQAVPAEASIARLGGDEFAVLLPDGDSVAAEQLAARVVRALRLSKEFSSYTLEISASVGITQYPADGDETLELLRKADQAMYQAKRKGRNRCQRFDPIEGEQLNQRIQLTSDLKQAIEQRAFELYFQPKLALTDSPCIEAEALLRWQHPQRGPVSPMEFIPLAEETGQILAIGQQVLTMACELIRDWHDQSRPPLKIAINLSARQLHDRRLLDKIRLVLAETGVSASALEFEITESVVMDDVAANLEILQQLKRMGATIAIDDFGTGYSSLNYLKKLPVDTLKIDRSFIRPLPDSSDDRSIVSAVISMAHNLGIQVVAEGVETEQQRELLCRLGCDYLQGYLLGRPIAATQFSDWLTLATRREQTATPRAVK